MKTSQKRSWYFQGFAKWGDFLQFFFLGGGWGVGGGEVYWNQRRWAITEIKRPKKTGNIAIKIQSKPLLKKNDKK